MNYASIRSMDISNGEGVGVALFVQGCHLHCYNCFNSETWDFNGGKEWTSEIEDKFIKLATRQYVKRVSILGGDPLMTENLNEILNLVNKIRLLLPQKIIWLYTGFYWEEIFEPTFTGQSKEWIQDYLKQCELRRKIISKCDVLIDGRYVDELRNVSLKWRGSENQRVIDIQKSLLNNNVILYCK